MILEKGQVVNCAIIDKGKRTGAKVLVEIAEVKRDHQTQEARSVRVKTIAGVRRCVWVQSEYLSA